MQKEFKKQGKKDLQSQGWVRRFVATEERASEFVKMYAELGFEVLIEPLDPEELPSEECELCHRLACESCVVIYTRLRQERNTAAP